MSKYAHKWKHIYDELCIVATYSLINIKRGLSF